MPKLIRLKHAGGIEAPIVIRLKHAGGIEAPIVIRLKHAGGIEAPIVKPIVKIQGQVTLILILHGLK